MNKLVKIVVLSLLAMLFAVPVMAAPGDGAAEEVAAPGDGAAEEVAVEAVVKSEPAPGIFSLYFHKVFAAGLIIIGAALGIGKIGSCAVESMARQPEVAGNIQTSMIIASAMIEGATLFALLICIIAIL